MTDRRPAGVSDAQLNTLSVLINPSTYTALLPPPLTFPPPLLRVSGNGTVPALMIQKKNTSPAKYLVVFAVDNDVQFDGFGIFLLAGSWNCRNDVVTTLTEPSNFFLGGSGNAYSAVRAGSAASPIVCRWLVDVSKQNPADGIAFQLHSNALQPGDLLRSALSFYPSLCIPDPDFEYGDSLRWPE
eukprot:tig00021463_g21624.t1